MKAIVRDASVVPWALFAGCWWASVELVLGSAMHASGSPLAGLAMGTIGLGSTVAIARVARVPGVILGAALLAATAKLGVGGPAALSPAIAILLSGAAAEAMAKRHGPVAAMAVAGLFESMHPWIFGRLITGRSWEAILARSGSLGESVGVSLPWWALVVTTVVKLGLFVSVGAGIAAVTKRPEG